jgi:succinate-semialdehyde dehydrogenase/glutarate-semialdehyde dehydrogenase
MSIRSLNPKNAVLVREFEAASERDIEDALAAAERAFAHHRRTTLGERASCMLRLADALDAQRDELARLMTDEMGKTLAAARAEVEKCARVCRYYADNAETMLEDRALSSKHSSSSVSFLPLGPLLAVMPWNFPAWQVFRAAVPAIMAGNVVLLKHASNVPRTALRLQSCFEAAGFEQGVFQTLLIGPDRIEPVLADARVRAATVTGSTRAGSAVAAIAGKYLKKTVLELGGSDPFIVMPSADVEQAAATGVTARIQNNGQSCIAAKRFIVHRDVFDRFIDDFVGRFEALKLGDPLEPTTDVGPLAMDRIRDRLDSQVQTLLDRGADRLTGAQAVDGDGFYYRPGVLSGIAADAPCFDEELFGPVAWVQRVATFEQALTLANATRYGLGSSLWTHERAEIERARRELDCGSTFVNALVASDPVLPFGGTKLSGHGRELARDGILEFVNRKTIVVA